MECLLWIQSKIKVSTLCFLWFCNIILFNTIGQKQNGQYLTDNIFKYIFLKDHILIKYFSDVCSIASGNGFVSVVTQGPVLLQQSDIVARISANGSAAFSKSSAAIG